MAVDIKKGPVKLSETDLTPTFAPQTENLVKQDQKALDEQASSAGQIKAEITNTVAERSSKQLGSAARDALQNLIKEATEALDRLGDNSAVLPSVFTSGLEKVDAAHFRLRVVGNSARFYQDKV